MPKSSSPVRLEADLMQAARLKGERNHRSAAEQIEYWAAIGRNVADSVNPDVLLAVSTGLARLKVEPVSAPSVDIDAVFDKLESDRASGALQAAVDSASAGAVRYQASSEFPGCLEQIDANGNCVVGRFDAGVFTPLKHA